MTNEKYKRTKGFYEFDLIHPSLGESVGTIKVTIAAIPGLIRDMQKVLPDVLLTEGLKGNLKEAPTKGRLENPDLFKNHLADAVNNLAKEVKALADHLMKPKTDPLLPYRMVADFMLDQVEFAEKNKELIKKMIEMYGRSL